MIHSKSIFKLIGILLLSFSFEVFSNFDKAEAHEISKVKGKKVLVIIDGDISRGQYYYTINSNGKKKGIIRILKVKGDKAIAKVKKGKARKGWTLTLRSKKGKKRSKKSKSDYAASSRQAAMYWGVIAGTSVNTMNVTFASNDDKADMTGGGFSFKGLFDFALFESLWFRGMVGMETFNVKGESKQASCNNTTDCKADISYLSADMWGRYIFTKGSFRPWVGGGMIFLFPMSKEVTALDEKTVTNTSNFALGGGFDWYFKPNMFLPFQVEYDLYPSSEGVTANSIAVRIGFGMEL